MTSSDPVSSLPGVGPKLDKALAKAGIKQIRDLLFYFPRRYIDFSQIVNISDAKTGQTVTVRGTIKSIGARFSFRARISLAEAVISDDTGSLKVVWFNQSYLAKTLKIGDEVFLSGTIEQYKGLQLTNPIYEKFSETTVHTARLVPVYRLSEGLYHRSLRNLIHDALPAAKDLEDILPQEIRKNVGLPEIEAAINAIHFPDDLEQARGAQERFGFEELFIQQLLMQRRKALLAQLPAPKIVADVGYIKKYLASLPFTLTASQKRALWELMQDMELGVPMNRLLQGDVGSGKTVVALGALLLSIQSGFQGVLLAPTEILAKQHYNTIVSILKQFDKKITTVLWTKTFLLKNDEAVAKKDLTDFLKRSKKTLIVGTHALLQQEGIMKNLGLVIVDEQHRFGVEQRSFLLAKNKKTELVPHLLSMSATPIPRTLAMSVFADLEISTLVEKPKGRQIIATSIIAEAKRDKAYEFIKKELQAGRQAFIITPRVEEGEEDVKSAKAEFERLAKTEFQEYKVGLVYGKLKGELKDEAMRAFAEKQLDVLVATSVVEIGIDVPNASVMIIEGAENFGLAQLHQLRGRVGRGAHKSYCLLFTNTENPESNKRLELFSKTDDGFALAEADLKLRGFGDLLGTTQSGHAFKFVKFFSFKQLERAKTEAKTIFAKDPSLELYPHLKSLTDPTGVDIHLQ